MKLSGFTILVAVCLIAAGYFLYPQFNETNIKIEYGPQTITQIKSSYKPMQPIFYFENNTVLVQKVVRDSLIYLTVKDSIERFSDSLNVKIVHTTVIDPDSIHARTFWEETYQIFKRVDSVFIETPVYLTEYKPSPFYSNPYFYSTLAFGVVIVKYTIEALSK